MGENLSFYRYCQKNNISTGEALDLIAGLLFDPDEPVSVAEACRRLGLEDSSVFTALHDHKFPIPERSVEDLESTAYINFPSWWHD